MNAKFEQPYKRCPVCNSDEIKDHLKDFRDINIAICKQCHVQFMNPVYSDEYLEEFYSNYTQESYTQKVIDEQHFTANDNLNTVEKFLGRTGTMLDYGCGNGEHSHVAKQRGWQVTGYDVDCDTARSISSKFQFDYHCGNFEEIDWQGKTFDLVYTNQVVEHLKDPINTLGIIHNLLNEGGLFLVGVPNIHSLSRRIKFFFEKTGLRRKNVGKYYDSDHHVFYYDKKSIVNMLKIAGFKTLRIYNSKKPKVDQNPVSKFFRRYIFEKFVPNSAMLVIAKKV